MIVFCIFDLVKFAHAKVRNDLVFSGSSLDRVVMLLVSIKEIHFSLDMGRITIRSKPSHLREPCGCQQWLK